MGPGTSRGQQTFGSRPGLSRGIEEKALPAENTAFQFYLAGALEMSDRTDEALRYAKEAADCA